MPPARKNWIRDSVEGIARLINYSPAMSVINPLATTVGNNAELSKIMSIYRTIFFPSIKFFFLFLEGGVGRMRVNEYLSP